MGGIEFQRTNICLNEFPAPLMLRGGRASKRGGIDSEFMFGAFVCFCVCVCFTAWVNISVWLLGNRPLNCASNEPGRCQCGATLPESEG